jgi:hypothetical protein
MLRQRGIWSSHLGAVDDEQQADTWKQYAWVARSVEKYLRKDLLTYKHHQEVAPLGDDEQVNR